MTALKDSEAETMGCEEFLERVERFREGREWGEGDTDMEQKCDDELNLIQMGNLKCTAGLIKGALMKDEDAAISKQKTKAT